MKIYRKNLKVGAPKMIKCPQNGTVGFSLQSVAFKDTNGMAKIVDPDHPTLQRLVLRGCKRSFLLQYPFQNHAVFCQNSIKWAPKSGFSLLLHSLGKFPEIVHPPPPPPPPNSPASLHFSVCVHFLLMSGAV